MLLPAAITRLLPTAITRENIHYLPSWDVPTRFCTLAGTEDRLPTSHIVEALGGESCRPGQTSILCTTHLTL